jgi:hypothetical protein
VGTGADRLVGGLRREPGDRSRVPGLSRMVDDRRQVSAVPVEQRGEYPLVQLDPAGRR